MNSAVLNTILRYGVDKIGGMVTMHGIMTDATWQIMAGVILAVIPAAIGALGSTDKAAIKRIRGVSGVTAVPAADAYRAGIAPVDPTWNDPNAR